MEIKGINVIITGSTGMVGEGVLQECISDPRIASIILLNRRTAGVSNPKLTEVLVRDLFSITGKEFGLWKPDACFHCLGVTSFGKSEEEYSKLTYELTMKIARTMYTLNPDMTFCYVSAKGTDNSERGDTMWARVKGKTENELGLLGFRHLYKFRPFLLTPSKGLHNTHGFYNFISWLFPLGRLFYPEGFCTLKEFARAMIQIGYRGYDKTVITPTDMAKLAKL